MIKTNNKGIWAKENCCGKPLKINDPRRKRVDIKRKIKKKFNLK
jgi:hypothetical protein